MYGSPRPRKQAGHIDLIRNEPKSHLVAPNQPYFVALGLVEGGPLEQPKRRIPGVVFGLNQENLHLTVR